MATLNPPHDPREAESADSARQAGLRYVSDLHPGLRRARRGSAFAYFAPDGTRVEEERTLARIKSLAIPPAWQEVWICTDPRGHIQATARDARGRKVYRYHPRWRTVRDAHKYERMAEFGRALPGLRERTDHDLRRPGMPREKVLAAVVRLLERTRIRIGNDEYRKQNQSFGLTTLRRRHTQVNGSTVRFEFNGKSGKHHSVRVSDPRLARVIQRCQDLPGYELFQYLDEEGNRHTVDSEDVNEYLREATGGDFTAKDFRTWAGTVLAAGFLRTCEPCRNADDPFGRSLVVQAINAVSRELGNTPAVCRKSYVHPAILDAYLDGRMHVAASVKRARSDSPYALSDDEQFVLDLLGTMADASVEAAKAA